ncbi:MAG: radical SAM protein [Thermodesulfobacteriota bacterium]
MAFSAEPPFLISWNLTKRCNLKCGHCYLDSTEIDGTSDISTGEARRTVDQISSLNPNALLIMTGGEPLLRDDLFALARYAADKGLIVAVGTNGTLLDDNSVKNLLKSGVKGVGVSLDSITPDYHDLFRGVKGAWGKTVKGMEVLKRHGLPFQTQFTVTKTNKQELEKIVLFSIDSGAMAVNVFFLVCTGRGEDLTDLSPKEYEETLEEVFELSQKYDGRIMVRPRCAPHILRIAAERDSESNLLKGQTSGCVAGRGYMRISPDGFVTPCPYMPASDGSANIKEKSLKEIWEQDKVFSSLRNPQYKGKCKDCEYESLCGGCRARALAETGDMLAQDPFCSYIPKGKTAKEDIKPVWTSEAKERLKKAPFFLRGMIRNGVEKYAAFKSIKEITPELMAELRSKTPFLKDKGGN